MVVRGIVAAGGPFGAGVFIGTSADGPTADGPTADGPTADGPTADGTTADGVATGTPAEGVAGVLNVSPGLVRGQCMSQMQFVHQHLPVRN
jgi:hypothetical protein